MRDLASDPSLSVELVRFFEETVVDGQVVGTGQTVDEFVASKRAQGVDFIVDHLKPYWKANSLATSSTCTLSNHD